MTTHSLLPVTVVGNQKLKPRLHRLTLASEAFAECNLSGPDEFFALVMPKKDQAFTPFSVDGVNIRAAVGAMPESQRPELRWYTVRQLDRAAGLLHTDVVTHGDSGPGSRWIRRAQRGDTAGIFTCPALWTPPTSSQLLVADASALPALRHILAYQRANQPVALAETHVVAVINSPDEVEDGFAEEWQHNLASLSFVYPHSEASSADRHSRVAEVNATLTLLKNSFSAQDHPRSVWVSGEGKLTKAVRRLAVSDWGLPPENVVWVPFWFHGKARP